MTSQENELVPLSVDDDTLSEDVIGCLKEMRKLTEAYVHSRRIFENGLSRNVRQLLDLGQNKHGVMLFLVEQYLTFTFAIKSKAAALSWATLLVKDRSRTCYHITFEEDYKEFLKASDEDE